MELYLLRHGIAEDGKPGGLDADRALVPEGEAKLREVLRVARRSGVSPELILSSPYKRARQTADIAARELGYKGEIEETEALTPMGDPASVWREIRALKMPESVLLASHEPLVGQLTGYLLRSPVLVVDVKKGSLIRIDFIHPGTEPRGVLRWMLTPKLAAAADSD